MPISRREFLAVGCGALGATVLLGGGGIAYLAIDERRRFGEAASATQEWLKTAMAQTATNVAEMHAQGITPTPLASRVAEVVAQDPTSFPTLTLTPTKSFEGVELNIEPATPTSQPTSTEVSPTATLTKEEKREKFKVNIETAWDAARSLPPVVTQNTLGIWMGLMSTEYALKTLQKGDISSYEQLVEAVGGTLENPNLEFLQHSFLSESVNSGKDLDTRQAWVYSRPTKDEKDREFPKAYESKQILLNQIEDILTTAWEVNPTNAEIIKYYNALVGQLFTIQGGIKVEDTVLIGRNSYRADAKSNKRPDQPQRDICSVYTPRVEIGKEYFKNGILYLSNKVPFQFTFSWSKEPIEVDDPQRGAKLTVRSKDGKKVLGNIFVRVQDQGSLPKDAIFGITGVPEPVVGETGPWMSIFDTPCGPSTPAKQETKPASQPGGREEKPTPPQGPSSTPPKRATENPTSTAQGPEPTATTGPGFQGTPTQPATPTPGQAEVGPTQTLKPGPTSTPFGQ